MILPISAIWGGAIDPLAGNAQALDGTFDYNTAPLLGATPIQNGVAFSALFELDIQLLDGSADTIISFGTGTAIALIGISSNRLLYLKRDSAGRRIIVQSPVLSLGRQNIILTDTGSMPQFYKDGIAITTSIATDNLGGLSITPYSSDNVSIGGSDVGGNLLTAKIKQLELINRLATPTEIVEAADLGSFRGAGIAHNSGQYLFAVDFDKVDGQNPTTYANTPFYDITGNGGTVFELYL